MAKSDDSSTLLFPDTTPGANSNAAANVAAKPTAQATPVPAAAQSADAQSADDAEPGTEAGTEPLADAAEASAAEDRAPEVEADPRQRIKEQLDALKRRESELRRALVVAEHPALAEAIRTLQGRAYAIAQADAKLSQGLSKSEARRHETLDRKLSALREKRDALNVQIAALEGELAELGVDRTRKYQAERQAAFEQLLAAMGTFSTDLAAAGLEASELVPELEAWLPELRAFAEAVSVRGQPTASARETETAQQA